jgi:hypothetical protein
VPAASLLNPADRGKLVQRLRAVRPDARPAWGTLTAPRMLCHLADQLRVALGDVPARPAHNLASRTLLKFLVVNTGFRPPRGKIQTAPEMLASKPAAWDADLAACLALVERVGAGAAREVHPAFGPLTPEEWGKVCWKHMDHHLVQFGT